MASICACIFGITCIGASGAIAGIMAIKYSMIADEEGFSFKPGFLIQHGMIKDMLMIGIELCLGMSFGVFNLGHIAGLLTGSLIYNLDKMGYLEWMLGKKVDSNTSEVPVKPRSAGTLNRKISTGTPKTEIKTTNSGKNRENLIGEDSPQLFAMASKGG